MHRIKPVAVAATTLAVLGGGSAAALAAGGGSSSTSSTKAPTVEVPVQGARGTGSVTFTNAKGKTTTDSDAKVTCAALGNEYVVYEHAKGKEMRVVISDYNGPGNYEAMVSVARGHHRKGDHKRTSTAKTGARRHGGRDHFGKGVMEPVTVTSTGGSTSFTRTLTGTKHSANAGKTITVKADWTCTA